MRSRLWLLAPAALLDAGDIGLTLAGQPSSYWAGDSTTADEANPVAYPLLALSPTLFVGLALFWLAVLVGFALVWGHPLVRWGLVFTAMAHAIGGASWLTRMGSWGLASAA